MGRRGAPNRRQPGRAAVALATAALAAAALLGACGGGGKQDAHEASGTYKLDVLSASFPGKQRLGQQSTLQITVKNVDVRELPGVSVTIDGFSQRRDDPTLADPNRPIWVLNEGPTNADSALTNTWTLGKLPANQTRTFAWDVTAVRAGTYSLRYKVSAGLYGKAKAELPDGSAPKGSFIARINRAPRPVTLGKSGASNQ